MAAKKVAFCRMLSVKLLSKCCNLSRYRSKRILLCVQKNGQKLRNGTKSHWALEALYGSLKADAQQSISMPYNLLFLGQSYSHVIYGRDYSCATKSDHTIIES